MGTIERTHRFKRDYRREARGRHGADLDERLAAVVHALAIDAPLEPRHHDHALSGPWTDFRDCHIRPDLVLIYRNPGKRRPQHTSRRRSLDRSSLADLDLSEVVVHAGRKSYRLAGKARAVAASRLDRDLGL